MESDTIESSSESKFPLIAGIAGVALGVIALVLAVKAKNAAEAATLNAQSASASAQEATNAVASKADKAAFETLQADFGALKEQTSKGFADVTVAYEGLRKAVEARGGSRSNGTATGGTAGPGEYLVQKGDSLYSIARKNGLSLKALQDLNPGVSANLKIGQKLKVK